MNWKTWLVGLAGRAGGGYATVAIVLLLMTHAWASGKEKVLYTFTGSGDEHRRTSI
jgi:hypothetical protein